jgi:hypothetical protein
MAASLLRPAHALRDTVREAVFCTRITQITRIFTDFQHDVDHDVDYLVDF